MEKISIFKFSYISCAIFKLDVKKNIMFFIAS